MKQVKNISLLLLSVLMATSCSNEEVPDTPINNELVELGVTAGVSLTKSAIHADTHVDFKSIAVFASGTGYPTDNEAAIYTKSGSDWSNSATETNKKIMLSNETATIYAIYPSKNGNTDWSITPPSASSTIPVAVFQGNNGDQVTISTITVPVTTTAAGSPAEILSAPGEIDYMYGVKANGNDTDLATASNKTDESAVALKMKHALAMVSFRIYNDGTYSGEGHLTEIKLSNVSGSSLNAGNNPKMKISDGTITVGDGGSAATYTRVIKTAGAPGSDYYELGKVTAAGSGSGAGTASNIKGKAAKFSILVFPIPKTDSNSDVNANTIQVTFKIDDVEHTVPLGTDHTTLNWAAGTNSLYTAVLSGKGLSITSVAVAEWAETEISGDLGVD